MSTNSLTDQLDNINLGQKNVIKMSSAYLEAVTSKKSKVSVELENKDGKKQKVYIPSNVSLGNDIERIKQSVENLTGLKDNDSSIVSDDGSFREIIVGDRKKTPETLDFLNFNVDSKVKTKNNPLIEKFMSPLTEVEMEIPNIKGDSVKVSKILLTKGDPSILEDGMTYQQVIDTINNEENSQYSTVEYDKEVENTEVRYHGKFDVISTDTELDGFIFVELESLLYNDSKNSVENSKELVVGDRLTNSDGSCEYEIKETFENIIKLENISGIGKIDTGENSLVFNSFQDQKQKVRIPIRMSENSAIFISGIDKKANSTGVKSKSKIFKSENFTVNTDGFEYDFNDYFSTKVSDISEYFQNALQENLMPIKFGVKPDKPEIQVDDFEVVQINEHITDSPTIKKLKVLDSEKSSIKSKISSKNSSIKKLSSKLNKGNYAVSGKAEMDENKLKKLVSEKDQHTNLLTSTAQQMKSILDTETPKIKPKYRVRGFWEVQDDLVNEQNKPVKIVQYQIRYRYLSPQGKTSNTQQYTFKSKGDDKSATFTPWNFEKTESLERKKMSSGKIEWVEKSESDADTPNINQLDIPINSGESVEFQVKAITEAGFPNSPLTSGWSKKVRMEYPESLNQKADIESIREDNSEDSFMVRISEEFENQGITKHISESFKEGDKYYPHTSKQIASGHVTDEQNTISQYDYTVKLEDRIKTLEEIVNKRYAKLTLKMLDSDQSEKSTIKDQTTINLFAGYYTDHVDLSDDDNFGDIVTTKFYLKILNQNAQTAEILSLNPGNPTTNTNVDKYTDVPVHLYGSDEIYPQKRGQIFYNRKRSIDNEQLLYKEGGGSPTTISESDINPIVGEYESNERKAVHKLGGSIEDVTLSNDASFQDYVAMTNKHPLYRKYLDTGDSESLISEFERISNFNPTYRENVYQNPFGEETNTKYSKNDKYLIGRNSVGATLYTSINDIESYQVEGVDTSSTKTIFSGDQDSIIIPLEYQFRMSDAFGNPNGDTSLSLNSEFEYKKKIGFDVHLQGSRLSFDVIINSKFRASNSAVNKLGIKEASRKSLSTPNID